MSVRFDSATDEYTLTLSLGVRASFTFACWGKIAVDRNAFSTFVQLTGSGLHLQTDGGGTDVGVWDEVVAGFTTALVPLTVGKWYHLGYSVRGPSGFLYVRAEDSPTPTIHTFTGAARTLTDLHVGDNTFDEWLNGNTFTLKAWTAGLSSDELLAESRQVMPRRWEDLEGFWPFVTASPADYSGRGRNLSAGASATTEASPPTPWRLTAIPANIKGTSGQAATVTPAVIAAIIAVPQPAANVQAGPSVIAATATLPAAGVNVAAGPSTIAATVSVPQPAANVGAGPAVIPVTVMLPQATVETGGNATAAPAVVAATVSIPQPGVNVSAGPAVVATTVSLPQSAVNVAAGPAVVPVTVTLPSVGVNSGTGPQVIAAIVALPTPGANISAGPVVIPVTVSLPQATAVDEGTQVNGTSTPTVSGLAAVATAAALAAVAAVSHGNSSTPTVSDG